MERAVIDFLDAVQRSVVDLFDTEENAGQDLGHGNHLLSWVLEKRATGQTFTRPPELSKRPVRMYWEYRFIHSDATAIALSSVLGSRPDRKSTRLISSHGALSRMPSSAWKNKKILAAVGIRIGTPGGPPRRAHAPRP